MVWSGVTLYVFLFLYALFLLVQSKTGASILSPWQTIHPAYIYVFTVATFILGLLIFSSLKIRCLLLLLVLHSFLLHSYLPLTHNLLYGADQWRHIANEQRTLNGQPYLKAKLSSRPQEGSLAHGTTDRDSSSARASLGMTGEAVGRLAYSQSWFLTVGIARITGLDLITINKWLIPILWSLCFPLLLYKLGRTLEWSERQSLFLVWLSALPFAFQAAGSFTLPVNLGFLIWLAFLIPLFQRLRNPHPGQILLLVVLGVVSLFGYPLFGVLYWLVWGVGEVMLLRAKRSLAMPRKANLPDKVIAGGLPPLDLRSGCLERSRGARWSMRIDLLAMTFITALVLPALELIAGYSHFVKINWLAQLKQIIGNFSAWYLGSGPRPHDIATGNIIFNQVPSYTFVSNWFTVWRGWLVIFMLAFWIIVIVGGRELWRRRTPAFYFLLPITLGLTGSYLISRYFLQGEEVLTRRLDVVLALLFVILFVEGFYATLSRCPLLKKEGRGVVNDASPHYKDPSVPATGHLPFVRGGQLVAIAFLSIGIAASYSLGPDTNTVSTDEYQAMQYIWSQEQHNSEHCVLAETYPLLALEAISNKEIIGGGFPIDATFGQLERQRLYSAILKNSSFETWKEVLNLIKLNSCWLVAEKNTLQYNEFVKVEVHNMQLFGNIVVWHYTGQSQSLKIPKF